mmetsp:Transcript_25290/g.42006  ORF Transcript_25290/g.42006 Transcript_25290/m.42006 type:complete len:297 (+) Transcript_25290:139-1029(+)|eukprot:CAMPEP_0119011620 /NCGR_PEP_ID=MMETSP1176-20130426/5791_1 /TAXON_ID=265551 /ORGANISM="Synedropsis recta cf, Strain CCMP1620" /LENGTH=296 /DNA_ID=CAMNT_0006964475 /DNA_START=761 /DNA_END=1651 /DNA_ORIENTATION=+
MSEQQAQDLNQQLQLHVDTDIIDDDANTVDDDDDHPVVSPETPAESFFISPELRTTNVSAFALASQLRTHSKLSSSRSQRSGTSTVATDDFQSACGNEMELEEEEAYAPNNTVTSSSLFGTDILVLSRSVIPEDDDDDDDFSNDDTFQDTMSTNPTSNASTPTIESPPNAAQVVYEKAKDVWTWGKGLPVVGFFEGITEAVASKVVSVAGTSLEEIDGHIKPVVAGLDTSYLNPAIEAIVKAIMSGLGKADDTFRPVIQAVVPTVLGPLGLLEDKKNGEKESATPELTTAPVVSIN